MRLRAAALALLLPTAACTDLPPDLAAAGSAEARAAPFPVLVPLESLVPPPQADDPAPAVEARAARLRARAAALRSEGGGGEGGGRHGG